MTPKVFRSLNRRLKVYYEFMTCILLCFWELNSSSQTSYKFDLILIEAIFQFSGLCASVILMVHQVLFFLIFVLV